MESRTKVRWVNGELCIVTPYGKDKTLSIRLTERDEKNDPKRKKRKE